MKNIIILLLMTTLLSCNKTTTTTPAEVIEPIFDEHEINHIHSAIINKIRHRKNNVIDGKIVLNDAFNTFTYNGKLTKFSKESGQWYGEELNITYEGYFREGRDYSTRCYYKFDVYVTDTIVNHIRELIIKDVQNDNIFFTEYKVK